MVTLRQPISAVRQQQHPLAATTKTNQLDCNQAVNSY